MLWYLLKVTVCSGILLGYYWMVLRNKVFHLYNRFYLLGAILLSLSVPLIQINIWQNRADHKTDVIKVLQAVSSGNTYMDEIVITNAGQQRDWLHFLPFLYLLVSFVLLFLFIKTLYNIRSIIKKYPVKKIEDISFINTENESGTPFSFLRYIFWNNAISLHSTEGKHIFKHEVAHIREKHTHDKLFVNSLLIFFWSNPFFWLIRKELNMIHEFIADKRAVEFNDTAAFAAMILHSTYPQHRFEIVNNFFYSPIKRRLLMLTKKQNPRAGYFGRLLILPLAAIVFAAFGLKVKDNAGTYYGKKITVVIDAGHGGADNGAVSRDGIFEKDINLAIAKKVKELNTNEAIQIILTRSDDVYMAPDQKAAFAKSSNAGLLISLHTDGSPQPDQVSGMSFMVSKDEYLNSSESKVLATALINEFSHNYGLKVENKIIQRQQGVWILQANTFPSVLIETGYINNKSDLAYLNTNEARETIAKNLLAGIQKYLKGLQIEKTVLDTVPQKISSNQQLKEMASEGKGSPDGIDTKKALIILNGKILGSGKAAGDKIGTLNKGNITVKWLGKSEAIAKYGNDAAFGACEVVEAKDPSSSNSTSDAASSAITGANTALIVVDGVIKEENFNLNAIDPAHIETVNVLKGNSATALYGEKGKNGVILIKTKTQYAMQEIKVNGREKTTPQLVNADAASDKQQVLYIGVDNTITVEAANIDARDLNITVSQGTKTGGNGKFIVHFTKPGNVTISLFKNGSSAILKSFDFQVKPVPDPVNGKLPMYISSNYHLVADMEKESFENADSKSREGNSNIVFTKVETDPEFPGGVAAWRKYLEKNVNSSLPVSEGWKPGIYKIVVSFIVNADGSVRNIETDSYKGSKTAQHCIDLIKNAPKWQPAVQNGRKVNAYKKQPITFVIEDEPAGKTEPGVYSVPFKVHLMYDGRENVFAMVGNGTYTVKQGQLFYLNGKIANPKRAITGSNVSKMESYDEETGKKYFGVKGKSGVLRITTKG